MKKKEGLQDFVEAATEDFVDQLAEDFVDSVAEGDELMAQLKFERGKLAWYWRDIGKDAGNRPQSFNKHLARVESVDRGKLVLQPLPGINAPLPAAVKRLAEQCVPCVDGFDPEKLERRLAAARKISELRKEEVREAFSKIERKPKDASEPKAKERKAEILQRWAFCGDLVAVMGMKDGWGKTVLLAVNKGGGMTLAEITEAVSGSETAKASKMSAKVAAAWYVNDLTKKKLLERC